MEGLKAPGELSFEGNVSENWRRWKRAFQNYLLAINLVLAADGGPGNAAISKRQVAILLHTAGEEADEICSQFEYAENESADVLADVLAKFEAYCNPRQNILYEWYVFWSLCQGDGEPIDVFLKRLKTQALKCEFGDQKDRMMLCRIVFGLSDAKLKERLLRDSTITLVRAMNDIRAAEMTRKQILRMTEGDKAGVATVHTNIDAVQSNKFSSKDEFSNRDKIKCKYCSYTHVRGRCPAYGKKCRKCSGDNHFEKVCPKKSVQSLEVEDVNKQMNSLFVGTVATEKSSNERSWTVPLVLAYNDVNTTVPFKVDTGAETNVVTLSVVKSLKAELTPTTTTLRGYNKAIIKNVGQVNMSVQYQGQQHMVKFEVVDEDLSPILGLETCEEFGIVKRVNEVTSSILESFPDVFEGVGCLEGEHEISIDPTVRPVVHAARRVPISMMDRVKNELDTMAASGIITKVDKPTDWVSSMVCVEKKDGSVRICLDPKDLNRAVRREHHHIPTMEDIAFKFTDMKFFTILDMKHGYWHVALTEKSSLLTTFNTPFGRYCFRRLPFGLHSSAEVFEKRVEQLFGDLPVSIYFDDLIVAGRTQEEHDDNLRKLLVRAKEVNVKFNKEKIQLNRSEVQYLGHIVSKDGLRPDPVKIEAIADMPNPEDKTGIQRVLGCLNFLRSYIPNMSALTEPLRKLLKDDVLWTWGPEQQEAMAAIKRLFTSEPILQYFDVNKETHLQVDASQSGLGAVLLQDGRPIAYGSRSLTETECHYPQIDKELLAIVYGCEKFHSYLYGRAVFVQTDHQPLVTIIGKPLHKVSPRLQRLLLRLQRYDIAKVTYVPGKYLYIADTLSRAYLQKVTADQTDLEGEVVMVHALEITDDWRTKLAAAYKADPTMSALKEALQSGWAWPCKSQVPAAIQPYWNVRAELYEYDEFIYVGERLVIPQGERKTVLEMLHMGHLGIQKCRDRALKSVYWPGLSTDIEVKVSSCNACARFGNRQMKEPLIPHEVPELPWNKVAMDILEFRSKSYLVVVDCYSHFPELRILRQKRAEDVILALKSIFSVHGVPLSIIADNMPFNSQAMHSFAKEWSFTINTSSPHYARSNGMAERYVQTTKQFMKKCEFTGEDVYRSLLAYRETTVAGCAYSPAEMLFNRSIRSNLPLTTQTLMPSAVQATEQLRKNQDKRKEYYDSTTKLLPPLQPGDKAFVRTDSQDQWRPATVVDKLPEPRSYLLDNGQNLVRRNRVHIKPDKTIPCSADENYSEPGQQPTSEEIDETPPVAKARTPRSTRGVLPARFKDYAMD